MDKLEIGKKLAAFKIRPNSKINERYKNG